MEGEYYEETFTYVAEDDSSNEDQVSVQPEQAGQGGLTFFDSLASMVLSVTVLLSLFFFIPSQAFPFGTTKGAIIYFGTIIALISWLIARLKSSSLSFPKTRLSFALLPLTLIYLLSALFSDAPMVALFGTGAEIGTFMSIFVLSVLLLLIPTVFKRRKDITQMFGFLFVAFIIITVIQLLRLFIGPGFLSFGVLTSSISNIVGNWNDLGVFYGLVSVMSLIALEQLPVGKRVKTILYVLLGVSLFFLAVVNYPITWLVLGLISLFLFVYSLARKNFFPQKSALFTKEGLPVTSIIVFIIALVFIISRGSLGSSISEAFDINRIEARPSYTSTLTIGKDAIKENPLLGNGPNLFARTWVEEKPAGVNQTLFWNVDFAHGVGVFPTALTTVGLLGTIAWVIFLLVFLIGGFRSLFRMTGEDLLMNYLSISSFVGALYLWLFSFFYIPNIVMFGLAFVLTGLFLATQAHLGRVRYATFSFVDNPRGGFVSVLVIVLLLIVSVTGLYFGGTRYLSQVAYSKGLITANTTGDIGEAESKIIKALNMYESAQYYRSLSQVYLFRVNQIVSTSANPDEALRAEFQTALGQAIESAQRATQVDETDYRNWLALGGVYEAIVPLGIEGARESAVEAYNRAGELNPTSPAIDLVLARLALNSGDIATARTQVEAALQKKSNYTEAVFLLSQIEVQDGNIEEATQVVAAAAQLAPNDATIFFQLGLLFYNQDDFANSAAAFERAVAIRNEYSNARYFLGLSYEELGRSADAIVQFEMIEELNPGNAEVGLILSNLRAGLAPFNGAPSQIDTTPESGTELPIEEKVFNASAEDLSANDVEDVVTEETSEETPEE